MKQKNHVLKFKFLVADQHESKVKLLTNLSPDTINSSINVTSSMTKIGTEKKITMSYQMILLRNQTFDITKVWKIYSAVFQI